jgi:hypothetical protein
MKIPGLFLPRQGEIREAIPSARRKMPGNHGNRGEFIEIPSPLSVFSPSVRVVSLHCLAPQAVIFMASFQMVPVPGATGVSLR